MRVVETIQIGGWLSICVVELVLRQGAASVGQIEVLHSVPTSNNKAELQMVTEGLGTECTVTQLEVDSNCRPRRDWRVSLYCYCN